MVHSLQITKSSKHVSIACPHIACSLIGKGTRVSLSLWVMQVQVLSCKTKCGEKQYSQFHYFVLWWLWPDEIHLQLKTNNHSPYHPLNHSIISFETSLSIYSIFNHEKINILWDAILLTTAQCPHCCSKLGHKMPKSRSCYRSIFQKNCNIRVWGPIKFNFLFFAFTQIR